MVRDKQLHISWRLAIVSVSYVVGVLCALWLDIDLWAQPVWFLTGALGVAVGLFGRGHAMVAVLCLGALLIGVWRGSNVQRQLQVYDGFFGTVTVVRGRVAEDPTRLDDGGTRMRLADVVVNERMLPGTVWVSVSDSSVVAKRSDIVTVRGQMSSGFGTIPAALYRAQIVQVKRQDYVDLGRDVRDWFAGGLRVAIKEPEASLASGFIVGQKTTLPEKLDSDLRLLGLTHIVVASGYNLSVLVRYSRKLFNRLSRATALFGGAALVFSFMQITGASPSMARASLVTGVSLVVWFFGRTIHPFVLLALAAGLTVGFSPSYAWGDLGWLLSFSSFVGVLVLSPLLHSYFWADQEPGVVRQVLFETFSAQLLTLPITVYLFGYYSPLSLLANMLILPLIPLVMIFGLIAGLVGTFVPQLGPIVGAPAQLILSYMSGTVARLATLPFAQSELTISMWHVVVCYALLSLAMYYLWRASGHRFREFNIVE